MMTINQNEEKCMNQNGDKCMNQNGDKSAGIWLMKYPVMSQNSTYVRLSDGQSKISAKLIVIGVIVFVVIIAIVLVLALVLLFTGHQIEDGGNKPGTIIDDRPCTKGVDNSLTIGNTRVKPMCDRIERNKHISTSSFSSQNWLIIQRRGQFKNKTQNLFEKNWKEYENGFGDVEREFWLGLKNMAQITSRGLWTMRVDLVDWDEKEYFAQYHRFKVGPSPSYTLHLSGFSPNSTLEDTLITDEFGSKFVVEGMSFSTKDNDQDKWTTNCAEKYRAGWWFNACMAACLNGINYDRKLSEWKGITWYGGGKTRGHESDTWKASIIKIKKI